ncbi:hypothetical protein EDC56_1171 [Sinobacterium caligoides]|uniref:Uncharacterized protein n=2 Tax=Sinobacterium caligoides TaxID=933926 RepID=A0A3N2E226_9GAMM|nr:hypothetical protein EDC56_1171 [Sinobacterium caligoides]
MRALSETIAALWRWLLALFWRLWRRFSERKYLLRFRSGSSSRRRRDWVKNLWLIMGGVMLIVGQLSWIVGLALLTVFLSFMILDEGR